jgi:ABC-type transporter Mla subunit MlaD
MEIAAVVSLLGAALGAAASAFGAWLQAGVLRRKAASGESAQDRVERLTGTLRDAMQALAATSEELQQEVEQGQQLVTKLQADAHTYEELARVNRAQAEAVAVMVRGELALEGRRSFWKQFVMNFAFFLAGVGVTIVVAALFSS